jgi:hypothetical protein
MKKGIIFVIVLGIIIGFLAPITYYTARAEYNYQTDLYVCETGNGQDPILSGYSEGNQTWTAGCNTPIKLIGLATENEIITECDKNIPQAQCGYSKLTDEEQSLGFITEFLYQRGTLPDDYIIQLGFIIIIFIISFTGTIYIVRKTL